MIGQNKTSSGPRRRYATRRAPPTSRQAAPMSRPPARPSFTAMATDVRPPALAKGNGTSGTLFSPPSERKLRVAVLGGGI